MRSNLVFIAFLAFVLGGFLELQADAASAGMLIRQLTSLVKWTRPSSKVANQLDGNVLQFEDGYLVETVVEGNDLGVVPFSIRASRDGELFAVDAVNSNIVRITPPLSRYSRARLVAGSFQGHTGHVDGKPSDARFNHPKGVTVDDKGNVYVADTSNLAIRKIGDGGVTTIAGGKSNVAGYRDGPSEDAKFSNDFDIVYVRSTCSLLVIDRGNVALRKISLNREDCDYENHSIVPTDLFLVAGAILIGYISCKLQQGFGSFLSPRMEEHEGAKMEDEMASKVIPDSSDVFLKEERESGWHSFRQVLWDIIKLASEAITGVVSQFMPSRFKPKEGLAPLKDSLIMPEDESPSSKQRTTPAPAPVPNSTPADRYPEVKALKMRSSSSKDRTTSSSKHRSSRRQEYSEFYVPGETPPPPQYGQVRSKIQKERSRHKDKNGEGSFGTLESKTIENKGSSGGYDKPKYEPYNFRSKYGADSYHFE